MEQNTIGEDRTSRCRKIALKGEPERMKDEKMTKKSGKSWEQ